jgi:hypothetical protein
MVIARLSSGATRIQRGARLGHDPSSRAHFPYDFWLGSTTRKAFRLAAGYNRITASLRFRGSLVASHSCLGKDKKSFVKCGSDTVSRC